MQKYVRTKGFRHWREVQMKSFFRILQIFLFSFMVGSAAAQPQQFSLDWTKIPKTFVTNDIKEVHSLLLRSKIFDKKDEFETTTEFQKRFENLKLIKIGVTQTAADMLVFQFKDSYTGMEAMYDADEQLLSLRLKSEEFNYLTDDLKRHSIRGIKGPGVETRTTTEGLRKVESNWWHGVGFSNSDKFQKTTTNYSLNATREIARQLKKDVAILVIGRLVKPYKELSQLSSKPTLERPFEQRFTTFFLVLEVTEIWFINSRSGEIYKKVKVDS